MKQTNIKIKNHNSFVLGGKLLLPSIVMGFPGGSAGKNLPAMQETWVQSLVWEDPLEMGIAAHSSILAWGIPWTVQSMGSLTHSAILSPLKPFRLDHHQALSFSMCEVALHSCFGFKQTSFKFQGSASQTSGSFKMFSVFFLIL